MICIFKAKQTGTKHVFHNFLELLSSYDLTLNDVCAITLYIKDMGEYATLNKSYINIINFPNPPARVCVECPLPKGIGVIMEALAFKISNTEDLSDATLLEKHTMHVQGISHWAPANIGPYSQAVRVCNFSLITYF